MYKLNPMEHAYLYQCSMDFRTRNRAVFNLHHVVIQTEALKLQMFFFSKCSISKADTSCPWTQSDLFDKEKVPSLFKLVEWSLSPFYGGPAGPALSPFIACMHKSRPAAHNASRAILARCPGVEPVCSGLNVVCHRHDESEYWGSVNVRFL